MLQTFPTIYVQRLTEKAVTDCERRLFCLYIAEIHAIWGD